MKIEECAGSRLPLRMPVLTGDGRAGRICGRAFGVVERYDVIYQDNSITIALPRSAIAPDWVELRK